MATAEQIVFPFVSLDFPGRASVTLREMAEKLSLSPDQLLNEIDRGALVALDLKGSNASKRNPRVPIESYRAYVIARMTGEFRADFVRDLPRPTRFALMREIAESVISDANVPADAKLRGALRSLLNQLAQ
jgi:hypothetical protein